MKQMSAAVAAGLICSLIPTAAIAKGGTIGIYAVIDQVTFEPEGPSPNLVRISGVFVIPRPMTSGSYESAQRGYIYFRIPPGMEEAARKDWNELRTAAGTGRVIGFCQYWVPNPADPSYPGHGGGNPHRALEVHVHADGEAASPEVYPLPHSKGIVKAGDQNDPGFDKITAELLAKSAAR
jgi:hypothetical protein